MAPDAPTPQERELALVNAFWQRVGAYQNRLAILRQYAQCHIDRPDNWNFGAIREHVVHDTVTLHADACFGCATRDRRLYWHHVIPIARGGSNYLRNRVPLCLRCHHAIHPWLPANRPGEQLGGEWWALGDVREQVNLLIRRLA